MSKRSFRKYRLSLAAIFRMGMILLSFIFYLSANAQERSVTDSILEEAIQSDSASNAENYEDEESDTAVAVNEDEVEADYFLNRDQFRLVDIEDSVYLRQVPLSHRKSLKEDESFWYADHVFVKTEVRNSKKRKSFWDQPEVEFGLWTIIIVGFVTFIIIYLVNSNVGIFRKSRQINIEESENSTEDIFEINYQKEIDKATSAGNYRLAIRMMFLRVIKDLSTRQLIQYKPDRTNFDYLLQLNRRPWYQDFFRLTRNYEYSWYGHFDLDKDKFSLIRKDFEEFQRKLN